MNITGGCLCKSVRYQITAAPIMTRTCWCRLCQYLGTGNATVNIFFPISAITIEGELHDYRSIADSGNVMHRQFCPQCGTHVLTNSEARPHMVGLRAGTLDDPEVAKPSATIWTSQAPSWACIDESLPQFPVQPPPVT